MRLQETPALRLRGLVVKTAAGAGIVDGVDLSVRRGQVLGVVGESGSGKTTMALALLGYARSGARIDRGTIEVNGDEFDAANQRVSRQLRGRLVSYVPQDPASALNPSLRIRSSIEDMLREHAVTPFRFGRDESHGERSPAGIVRVCPPVPASTFRRSAATSEYRYVPGL